MEECEFCSKKVRKTGVTSMTGAYCKECLELTINECERAIESITGRPYKRVERKAKNIGEKEIKDAFDALINRE